MDNGDILPQTAAIGRFFAKTHKGKNGETLYPAHADPLLSYEIDSMIDDCSDFSPYIIFFYTQKFGTEEFDKEYSKFKDEGLPKFIGRIESRLQRFGKKYLFSDNLTLADIWVIGTLIAFVYDEKEHNNQISQGVVQQNARVNQYCQDLLEVFKEWRASFVPQY